MQRVADFPVTTPLQKCRWGYCCCAGGSKAPATVSIPNSFTGVRSLKVLGSMSVVMAAAACRNIYNPICSHQAWFDNGPHEGVAIPHILRCSSLGSGCVVEDGGGGGYPYSPLSSENREGMPLVRNFLTYLSSACRKASPSCEQHHIDTLLRSSRRVISCCGVIV